MSTSRCLFLSSCSASWFWILISSWKKSVRFSSRIFGSSEKITSLVTIILLSSGFQARYPFDCSKHLRALPSWYDHRVFPFLEFCPNRKRRTRIHVGYSHLVYFLSRPQMVYVLPGVCLGNDSECSLLLKSLPPKKMKEDSTGSIHTLPFRWEFYSSFLRCRFVEDYYCYY